MKSSLWAALSLFPMMTTVWAQGNSGPAREASSNAPAAKGSAAGIMCLLNGDTLAGAPDLSSEPAFRNPAIQGIVLRAHWNTLERGEGAIDWSYFDQGVSLAKKNGKVVSLEVVASSRTPRWVFDSGAKSMVLTTPHTGAVDSVPLPWDSVYLNKWNTFVTAFAHRYDSSPTVAYVTMTGAGRGDEVHFATDRGDVNQLNQLGGVAVWLQGAKRIVDIYGKAFVHTPFVLATGRPVPGDDGKTALSDLLRYGLTNYPEFGFAPHALWSNSGGTGSMITQIMAEASATHTVGFQMYFSIQSSHTFTGDLDTVLNSGIACGAHFIEVYAEDVDNPANQAALEKANSTLIAKFGR